MYEKQTLPNGVRIVYEHMPHVRSAAIGVWVGVGSRYESPCEAGSAHFIEHMLFKGTAQHSASELAERMDAIGGQVNAYTTREGTCYYARVLDEHLDRAGDLLAEIDPRPFEAALGEARGALARYSPTRRPWIPRPCSCSTAASRPRPTAYWACARWTRATWCMPPIPKAWCASPC